MADYESPIVDGRVLPSGRAQSVMVESHAVASRAFLLSDDGLNRSPLPLVSGSVTLDSGSAVRRSGSITILGAWSDSPFSRLTPYGSRVLVQRGVRVATDSIEWMSLMVGRIVEVSQGSEDNSAAMTLSLKDDFASLAADRFDATTSTDTTKTVIDSIRAFVQQTLPNARFVDLTGSTRLCGKLDLQQDRAGGVVKLATSIAAEAFTGRDGSIIVRPTPTLDDSPRWILSTGDHGNLVEVERKRTMDGVYNRVLARGQTDDSSAGGTAAAIPYGEAKITDTGDPLFYGGPFGRVTRFYTSPLLKTNDQCVAAAASLLEKARGRNVDYSFTSLVNPGIDPGDVIWSRLSDGITRVHIVDSVSIPLDVSTTQNVELRTLELPAEQGATA